MMKDTFAFKWHYVFEWLILKKDQCNSLKQKVAVFLFLFFHYEFHNKSEGIRTSDIVRVEFTLMCLGIFELAL